MIEELAELLALQLLLLDGWHEGVHEAGLPEFSKETGQGVHGRQRTVGNLDNFAFHLFFPSLLKFV